MTGLTVAVVVPLHGKCDRALSGPVNLARSVTARAAFTRAVRRPVSVSRVEWMVTNAVGLHGILGSARVASQRVFAACRGFQAQEWIDVQSVRAAWTAKTRQIAIVARMIYLKFVRYRANEKNPCGAVGGSAVAIDPELSVPVGVHPGIPHPRAVFAYLHLVHESFSAAKDWLSHNAAVHCGQIVVLAAKGMGVVRLFAPGFAACTICHVDSLDRPRPGAVTAVAGVLVF